MMMMVVVVMMHEYDNDDDDGDYKYTYFFTCRELIWCHAAKVDGLMQPRPCMH